MSHDQPRAAAERAMTSDVSRPDGRDPVVVPLRLRAPRATAPRRAARQRSSTAETGGPRSIVAQIADYLSQPRSSASETAAPPPAPAATDEAAALAQLQRTGHADELASVLCQHIDVQLELIARHAPELAPSIGTVMRSLELLLKLRTR
ncbi:MAG: hypothetical protein HY060_19155 [Proteobacteria bacterium]|nr:hypothetical protein [Pseudomonadota bacterium]